MSDMNDDLVADLLCAVEAELALYSKPFGLSDAEHKNVLQKIVCHTGSPCSEADMLTDYFAIVGEVYGAKAQELAKGSFQSLGGYFDTVGKGMCEMFASLAPAQAKLGTCSTGGGGGGATAAAESDDEMDAIIEVAAQSARVLPTATAQVKTSLGSSIDAESVRMLLAHAAETNAAVWKKWGAAKSCADPIGVAAFPADLSSRLAVCEQIRAVCERLL